MHRPSEQSRTIVAAVLLAVIPSIIGVAVGLHLEDAELKKVVLAGSGTLFFGGFLGGVLKLLLDEVLASKRRRDDAAVFVTNVLADLKAVYDRVARARIVIPAHKSVKTYGDEMRDMIQARVQLRNVMRALERRADGMDESVRLETVRRVKQMECYLEFLTSEFRENYKPLSDRQRGYEERTKVMLERFAKDDTLAIPPELPGFIWESIAGLKGLSDFIGAGTTYKDSFETPLDDASALLRGELARILRTSTTAG